MEVTEGYSLECPNEFEFPFPPYEIQKDFMTALYMAINNKKLGIFESPTGTGKSLSILCGAIRWLKDFNHKQQKDLSEMIEKLELQKNELSCDSNDWLTMQSREIEINKKLINIRNQFTKLLEYEEKMKKLREVSNQKKFMKVIPKVKNETPKDEIESSADIDDEMLLVADIIEHEDLEEETDQSNKFEPIKIYISSRTHSQLAQFVGEIVKSPFGKNIRAVSLASRQIYCINQEVTRLKSMALINERCLEMQKGEAKTTEKEGNKTVKKQRTKKCQCPFYKQQQIENLRDLALSEVTDVEELISAAKELKACPYYASRKAADDAEIVLIPYNTLLHKATREANGIKLKNNVVIIDEAHNLLESLAQMHNVEISLHHLKHGLSQLKGYKARFDKRFSATNLLMINQLIFIINNLKEGLEEKVKDDKEQNTEISKVSTFVLNRKIENFNMFKLVKFARDAKLAQKIRHYAIKYPNDETEKNSTTKKGVREFLSKIETSKLLLSKQNLPEKVEAQPNKSMEPVPVNPLLQILSFLESLTYSYEDARIMMVKNCKYQFLLLNPTAHFRSIVEEARSVIVTGGTMKPLTEFRDRLFKGAGAEPERIIEFSCDHIIPAENILPIIITNDKRGGRISFEYKSRMKMINVIRETLQEACATIPGGIVVFFPSYQFENWVWEQLKNFSFGRPVFREPKDTGSVDDVLEKYAYAIRKSNTKRALLFSVVGGKLSEGLNFSDDLGRCVIVIGLPYANIKAADLKEKMSYLEMNEGPNAGRIFYENLCMKSVNQCIGRAVRHRNDYATVILLDERYNRNTTKQSLPGWIKRSLQVSNFDTGFSAIRKFFKDKM